ncbi:MAG: hypothetical protein QOD74_704 [Variibacter sp.]|jgi:hypothetical protein|nr:hypothetical protein [Variibacter sp.]
MKLYFVCPDTGATVDVGIDSEIDTVLRIKSEHVKGRCPHCAREHDWLVRDAYLTQPAAEASRAA